MTSLGLVSKSAWGRMCVTAQGLECGCMAQYPYESEWEQRQCGQADAIDLDARLVGQKCNQGSEEACTEEQNRQRLCKP